MDGVIRIKRHNLSLRQCVSSSFVRGIGVTTSRTLRGLRDCRYQCTRVIKINFNHFEGTFFIAIFRVCQIRFRARTGKRNEMVSGGGVGGNYSHSGIREQ